MAGWWKRVEKALDVWAGVRETPASTAAPGDPDSQASAARGLVAGFEARMAGILVSALREAFNRDAARLEAEREQAEHERRRAELALQLEVSRQAADREAGRLRAVGLLALVVWLASLLFVAVRPFDGVPEQVLLGLAWACLTGALGAVFAGYRRVKEVAERAVAPSGGGVPAPPRIVAGEAASWLAVAGLGLAAVSLLISL